MQLYPSDLKEKLEFDKVLEYCKSYCLGEEGIQYFNQIEISTSKEEIVTRLNEVDEYFKSIQRGENIPLSQYEKIEEDLYLLSKQDYVLDIESVRRIYNIVQIGHQIHYFFQDYTRHKLAPLLTKIVLEVNLDRALLKEIDRVFDEEGNVRPNASPELTKISKAIGNKEREVDKVFSNKLLSLKDKGYLAESGESIRNGRRVLAVFVENKRKIDGLIHDESGTGKTVFIEPEETLQLNNIIFNLYAERRSEIYKIIRDLSKFLRSYRNEIDIASQVIRRLDIIRAKAKFAQAIDATKPTIVEKPKLAIKDAKNPVLYLKQNQDEEVTVPFTLDLHGKNQFLILSGPNAGGKSVTMKSVGLLQMMVQAGMMVPCDENSKFGIFKKLFVDIGDQQSLEDDLSTYSSHLSNMKYFLEQADKNSLVLIDEFGAGTDPKIGGAIAESILRQLGRQKAWGVITTHYSNLKFFGFKQFGFVNASMEFDKVELKPTYQLIVGKPGSSFAFEIAKKIGLDEKIISYAKHKTGKHENAIDQMLVSLQAERQEFEEKMTKLLEKEEQVDRLIENYSSLQKDLDFKRRKVKLTEKESQLYQKNEENKQLQKLIKEIKEAKDLDRAKDLLKKRQEEKKKEQKNIVQLKEQVYKDVIIKRADIRIGAYAKIRNTNTIGEIVSIDKKHVELAAGMMTMRIPIKDLVAAREPITINSSKSVNLTGVSGIGRSIETTLDLREYRVEDAMMFLEEFVEKGLINNAHELKIIHGEGTGVLRKNVWKKLKEYKLKQIWHPEPEMGGEGVTLIKL